MATKVLKAPAFSRPPPPGAFDLSLQDPKGVFACYGHDKDRLLGSVADGSLIVEKRPEGLWYRVTGTGREMERACLEVCSGRAGGSSFSCLIREETFRLEGTVSIRELYEVELCHVSPGHSPAYDATTVAIDGEAAERFGRVEQELRKMRWQLEAMR